MGQSLNAEIFFGIDLGDGEDWYDYETDKNIMPEWLAGKPYDEDARYDDEHDDGRRDWEDVLAERLGWVETIAYPQAILDDLTPAPTRDWRADSEARSAAYAALHDTPEHKAYKAEQDIRAALLKDVGVEIDHYGYESNHRNIRITGPIPSCGYGASKITPEALEIGQDWIAKIVRFCTLMDIPFTHAEIGWHLAASYG